MADATRTPQQLAADLRGLANGKQWRSALTKAYRPIGTKAAQWARAEMRSGDAQLARASRVIRGSASQTGARINVGGAREPGALAFVWGTKGPTGWYAGWYTPPGHGPGDQRKDRARAHGYRWAARRNPNNPRWVGNTWTIGRMGEGPRGLNDALAKNQPQIVDEVTKVIDSFSARAFPTPR